MRARMLALRGHLASGHARAHGRPAGTWRPVFRRVAVSVSEPHRSAPHRRTDHSVSAVTALLLLERRARAVQKPPGANEEVPPAAMALIQVAARENQPHPPAPGQAREMGALAPAHRHHCSCPGLLLRRPNDNRSLPPNRHPGCVEARQWHERGSNREGFGECESTKLRCSVEFVRRGAAQERRGWFRRALDQARGCFRAPCRARVKATSLAGGRSRKKAG